MLNVNDLFILYCVVQKYYSLAQLYCFNWFYYLFLQYLAILFFSSLNILYRFLSTWNPLLPERLIYLLSPIFTCHFVKTCLTLNKISFPPLTLLLNWASYLICLDSPPPTPSISVFLSMKWGVIMISKTIPKT